MEISKFWLDAPKYSLLEAAYLVCGLEPQSPKETAPAKVISACRQMKEHITKEAPRYIGIHPQSIPVMLDFIRSYADYFGETDFFNSEPAQIDNPLTESQRDKYLKQIGVMALVLASKPGKYQKGDKSPNPHQIVKAVQEIIQLADFPGKEGTGRTELDKSIKAGLKLLQDDD